MIAVCDDSASTTVPADDRGLAYGDGLFETLACAQGQVLALEAHLDRLYRGCSALNFAAPHRQQLRDAVMAAVRGPEAGVIKMILTRGSGGRGYTPPLVPEARLRVSWHSWPRGISTQRNTGVHAVRLTTRLGHNPALAGLKHLNRLDQVLAARELSDRAPAEEGIVCDHAGHPICGVMSNLFLVRGGSLVTPRLNGCGVAGIVRESLLAQSAAGSFPSITVRAISNQELDEADEVFLTNSIRGVRAVRCLDSHELGAPGPVARLAQRLLGHAGVLV